MVTLRDATPADAWDIAAVHVGSWQVGYRGLLPDQLLDGLSVLDRERWWHEALSNPGARSTLLVTEAHAVLGFAAVGPDRDGARATGELYAMYLDPGSWGQGIGRVLHTAALTRLRAFGYQWARLWVLAGNRRALGFYRREGWAEDGRSKRVPGPGGIELEHCGLARRLPNPPGAGISPEPG